MVSLVPILTRAFYDKLQLMQCFIINVTETIDDAMSALDVKNERNNEIGKADSRP